MRIRTIVATVLVAAALTACDYDTPRTTPPADTAPNNEAAACTHAAGVITSPTNNQQVNGSEGVTVTGSISCSPNGVGLYIMDQPPNGTLYMTNPEGINVNPDGSFSAFDGPMGDEASDRTPIKIIIVAVPNGPCSIAVAAASEFPALPSGCYEVAQETVLVSS